MSKPKLIALILLAGCAATIPKSTTYGLRLEECNRNAKTRADSEACEDAARAAYGRPPRDSGADK